MYRILYVDDEPGLLDLGKIYLEETQDFTVETEVEAKRALTTIAMGGYDAVVSDYQMPVMDGIAFLKAVRQQYGDLPFILFTGKGREEVVIEAINNGVDFYLQKGGDPKAQFAELAHKIRQAVSRKEAQSDRDRTEKNFQNLVDNAPDAIFIIVNDRYRYVNTAALRLLGAPDAGALLGTNPFDRIHPSLHPNIRERVRELIEQKRPVKSQDEVYLKLDGTPVDVEVSAVPFMFRGEHGSLLIVHSITERKRRETELRAAYEQIAAADEELRGQYDELARQEQMIRRSREQYRLLAGKMPVPVCVADDNEDIIYINERFTAVFGYTRDDIPTLKEWWNLAYPDEEYRRQVIATWSKAVDTAIAAGTDIPRLVYRVTCRDGTARDVEISGIRFEDRFLATFVDLTERIRAEKELRASEERFRLLLQEVPSLAIQGYALDGTTQYWNEASERIYGYTAKEAIGKNLLDLIIPGEMKAEVRDSIATMARTQLPIPSSEVLLQRRDGSRVPVYSNHALVTRPGHPPELFCIDIDLSERKKAEEQLRQSEKSYRDLFNTVRQAIYIQDADWKFIDVNDGAVAMYGYRREEFIGKTPDFLAAEGKNDLAATAEKMKKAFAGEPQQFVFWAKKKDGTVFRKDVRVYRGMYFGRDVLIAIGTDLTGSSW